MYLKVKKNFKNVESDVVELNNAEEIFPAYKQALERTDGKSTMIIEHGNFYNEEYNAKRKGEPQAKSLK